MGDAGGSRTSCLEYSEIYFRVVYTYGIVREMYIVYTDGIVREIYIVYTDGIVREIYSLVHAYGLAPGVRILV
jgi:hypothetical protein